MAKDPIAWVAEIDDDDLRWDDDDTDERDDPDNLWATGLFSVFLDGPAPEHGPSKVSLDEALAWARTRARKVYVRVDRAGETDFSAGDEPIAGLPDWPPSDFVAVRRRTAGFEFMDRTAADPPIEWAALVSVQRGWGPTPDTIPAAIATAFAALVPGAETQPIDPGPAPWDAPEGGGMFANEGLNGSLGFGEVARVRFTVRASTRDDAWDVARAHGEAALGEAFRAVGFDRTNLQYDWDLESVSVYPEGSRLAQRRCSL